ncbi:MAG: aminoglycoside phosphotransferase family protein [Clostridia bacterium]|nr:aminoglycoside phosphotransferase family protein [Clostridia bacterium]
MKSFEEIYRQFDVQQKSYPYGNGHINDTYLITPCPKYILQRINTAIFTDPDGVMNNINAVTVHIKKKLAEQGRDTERETLTVIKTLDGKSYYRDEDGNCYRMYKFIEGAVSYDNVSSAEILESAAKSFGEFQNMLSDFPAETLHESIKNFHNTPLRFEALKRAIADNKAGRLDSVKEEVEYALSFENEIDKVTKGIEDGTIPLRVTHNDTKINNVLIDPQTGKGVAVIDLDTVMPGSLLYDFGDGLRTGGAMAAEDETDLSKVGLSTELFASYVKGFLAGIGDGICQKELDLLPYSVFLLTYECGIRFLTDYLEGDTYFKIHRPNHNLDRARTQLAMCKDIISKYDILSEIVRKAR